MRVEAEKGSNILLLSFREFCCDNTSNKARCFSDSDNRHSSQNKFMCLKFLTLLWGWLRNVPTKFNQYWGNWFGNHCSVVLCRLHQKYLCQEYPSFMTSILSGTVTSWYFYKTLLYSATKGSVETFSVELSELFF